MWPTDLPKASAMDTHPANRNLPLVNQAETILGVTIAFLVTAVFAIALRLLVRFRDRLWGADDVFVFISGVVSIIGDSMVCMMPFDGMGKHFYTLSNSNKQSYFKHVWATNVTYGASTTFIKLAILFQYLRLYNGQHRIARITTWVLIVITSIWGTIFFFLALFSCTPVQKNWNITMKGKCFGWGSKVPEEFFPMWAAHAASNMFLDIVVFFIPMPFLRNLPISNKSRKGLFALFGMGGIVVAMSVARMIVLSINRAGTHPTFDVTYYTPAIYLTSVLEVNIAMLCASIPIFWPLVTSLAMNKILVVKEVEVRSHRRESDGYGLHEDNDGLGLANMEFAIENKNNVGGRTSRLSVTHVHSHTHTPHLHNHHPSSSPPSRLQKKDPSYGFVGCRPASQESQTKLSLTRHASSESCVTGSPDSKAMGSSKGSVASYNEQWGYEGEREREGGRTKVGGSGLAVRAASPYDHVKGPEP